MDYGYNLYQWIWLKKCQKISTDQIKSNGKSRNLSQCALWRCPRKMPNLGNLQHLSQHVTFDQWAHQGIGLMFIIYPLSQEPINPVGYGFLIKFNMLMPLVKTEFYLSWYGIINFNLVIFKTCIYYQKLKGWWDVFVTNHNIAYVRIIWLPCRCAYIYSIFRCHLNSNNVCR